MGAREKGYVMVFVFFIRQNNDENRFITGILQVPKGTHFVIDETNLEPGHLIDTGEHSRFTLKKIIEFIVQYQD